MCIEKRAYIRVRFDTSNQIFFSRDHAFLSFFFILTLILIYLIIFFAFSKYRDTRVFHARFISWDVKYIADSRDFWKDAETTIATGDDALEYVVTRDDHLGASRRRRFARCFPIGDWEAWKSEAHRLRESGFAPTRFFRAGVRVGACDRFYTKILCDNI